MHERTRQALRAVAGQRQTPCYVYFADDARRRCEAVLATFGGRFGISYAVKANPNGALIGRCLDTFASLDCSSIGEVERARAIDVPMARVTFSGPAKRTAELERAVEVGVGEVVCESAWELETLNRLAGAAGRQMAVCVRINPGRIAKYFGVNMAGKPSQFGIDEEDLDPVLERLPALTHLTFDGFHIYSGTNCLSAEAIAENFAIFIELFQRFARRHDLVPTRLIFGSGFGIPYHGGQQELALDQVGELVNPQIDALKSETRFAGTECVLEMGRYLVGPAGYLLTTVTGVKRSRGTEIRMCDAGFNDHLAAFGLMGTYIRHNWPITKISPGDGPLQTYQLNGPLCTTIDLLAGKIELPPLDRGDVLAIGSSGAYGLTSSPVRFISHPEPAEYIVAGEGPRLEIVDVTQYSTDYGRPPASLYNADGEAAVASCQTEGNREG